MVFLPGVGFAASRLTDALVRVPSLVSSCMTSSWGGSLLLQVPGVQERMVYMCGPQPFMDSLDSTLKQLGVPAGQIFTENFTY